MVSIGETKIVRSIYRRFFIVVCDLPSINTIKDKFQEEYVLRFTHEPEEDRKLVLLDCLVNHLGESYKTS